MRSSENNDFSRMKVNYLAQIRSMTDAKFDADPLSKCT